MCWLMTSSTIFVAQSGTRQEGDVTGDLSHLPSAKNTDRHSCELYYV